MTDAWLTVISSTVISSVTCLEVEVAGTLKSCKNNSNFSTVSVLLVFTNKN